MQVGVGRDHQIVADRNVVKQLRVSTLSDANVIATLLDRRIVLYLFHSVFGTPPEPVRDLDMPGDLHLTGRTGANTHAPGTRGEIDADRSANLQGALK